MSIKTNRYDLKGEQAIFQSLIRWPVIVPARAFLNECILNLSNDGKSEFSSDELTLFLGMAEKDVDKILERSMEISAMSRWPVSLKETRSFGLTYVLTYGPEFLIKEIYDAMCLKPVSGIYLFIDRSHDFIKVSNKGNSEIHKDIHSDLLSLSKNFHV